jgi:hypothetical protein
VSYYLKDPESRVTYSIDWLPYLGGTTIAQSLWTVAPAESGGIAADDEQQEGSRTAATLSGGIVGRVYSVSNRVTLSDGSVDERAIWLRVEQR